MREDQFLRQRLQKEIPIEISPVLRDLITVIFCYQILRKPFKTLNLSQVSFPLFFPCVISPHQCLRTLIRANTRAKKL